MPIQKNLGFINFVNLKILEHYGEKDEIALYLNASNVYYMDRS